MLLSGSPSGRFVHHGDGFRLFSVIPSSLNDWPERRTMERHSNVPLQQRALQARFEGR
jgi:hypothetical protein